MITDLRLQNFRSYVDSSFKLHKGANIIVGPNASGKTNILEAILLLARGSSYRAHDADLVYFGAPWARLDAITDAGQRTLRLQRENDDKTLKSFDIDGHKLLRLSEQRKIPVVLFEPNHMQLFSGSPELRRSFLDDLLEQTQIGFGSTRRHYKRVLAHRNALLKNQPHDLRQQLFVWNLRLSELAGKIVKERIKLIELLSPQMTSLYSSLTQKDHQIKASYATRFHGQDYETALLKKLESSTELDILRGFTAYGPHRDDLVVSIDGHAVQEAASRGETRTLVLALKIIELGLLDKNNAKKPLLLLDDVFSELDSKRRKALAAFVTDYQTFITTTDADVTLKHIAAGNVIKLG